MSPRTVPECDGLGEAAAVVMPKENPQAQAETGAAATFSCPIDDMVTANLGALRRIHAELDRDILEMEALYTLYMLAQKRDHDACCKATVAEGQAKLDRLHRVKERVRQDIFSLERMQLDYWAGFVRPDMYLLGLRASLPW